MRTIDTGRFQYFRTGLVFDGERKRPQTFRTGEYHERYAVMVFSVSRNPHWGGLLVVPDWSFDESLCDYLHQFAGIFPALCIKRIGNHSGWN